MKFLSFSQTKLGSSFDITRARVGGASVIPLLSSLLFSVPPSRRKVLGAKPKQAGKKEGGWREGIFARLLPFPFRLRKGKAEGGFGGNSAFPLRNQIEASPATCPNTWRAEHHRKILFSLREKEIGRAQDEKSKEYFSVVWRACRAVAGLASLLGVLLKKSSNINQKTPQIKKLQLAGIFIICGEGGIRTLGTLSGTLLFESNALNQLEPPLHFYILLSINLLFKSFLPSLLFKNFSRLDASLFVLYAS